jgi:hypothetical protein
VIVPEWLSGDKVEWEMPPELLVVRKVDEAVASGLLFDGKFETTVAA